jgi:hypothetical protein
MPTRRLLCRTAKKRNFIDISWWRLTTNTGTVACVIHARMTAPFPKQQATPPSAQARSNDKKNT